jgi:O-antigen/teichoic acid export membrane protein
MFVLKVSAALIGVVSNIIFARILSLEEYGVFVQVLAAVTIVATLVTCGTPSLLTREVASYQAHESWGFLKGLVVWASRRLVLVSLAFVVITLFMLKAYAPQHWQLSGMLGLALVLVVAINQVRAALLRGLHHVIAADFPDQVVQPVIIMLAIGVSYYLSVSHSVNFCLLVSLGGSIVSSLLGLVILYNVWPPITKSTKAEFDNVLWKNSASIFFIISALTIVDSQIVTLLVGYLSGDKNAGIFQACSRLVVLVVFGLIVVNTSILPKIASAWSKKDIASTQFLVTYAARNGTLFAILTSVPLLIFPEWFLGLFGPGYESGDIALRILVLGQLVNTLSGPCGVILTMTGHQKFALKALMVSVSVSIMLNLILTPVFGLLGAAISVASSMLIWNLLMVYWAKKLTGIVSFSFGRLGA